MPAGMAFAIRAALAVALLAHHALAFSTMAGSCSHGGVKHGLDLIPPHDGDGGYKISLVSPTLLGSSVSLIRLAGDRDYRGFLLFAEVNGEPVGHFESKLPEATQVHPDCDYGVTHEGDHTLGRKENVFPWAPPNLADGTRVVFRATVVTTYTEWYAFEVTMTVGQSGAAAVPAANAPGGKAPELTAPGGFKAPGHQEEGLGDLSLIKVPQDAGQPEDIRAPGTTGLTISAPKPKPGGCSASTLGYMCMATPGEPFDLHWSLSKDKKSVDIAMVGRTEGWVGVGFRKDAYVSMFPADAVIGWAAEGGKGKSSVGAYKLMGFEETQNVPDPGQRITNTEVAEESGVTTVKFRRDLVNGGDVQLTPSGTVYLSWAVGFWDKLEVHFTRGTFELDLGATPAGGSGPSQARATGFQPGGGGVTTVPAPGSGPIGLGVPALRRLHGGMMIATWLVVAPACIAAARYLKNWPGWWPVHKYGQGAAVALGTSSFAIAWFYLPPYTAVACKMGLPVCMHARIGLGVVALAILQPVNAWFRPAKAAPSRKLWFRVHKYGGMAALLFGVYNCFTGVELLGQREGAPATGWGVLCWVLLVFWWAVWGMCEYVARSHGKRYKLAHSV